MVKFLSVCGVLIAGFWSPVQAEELMTLWPNQRASHQVTMDEQKLQYQMRGQDYIDHLYATSGEEPMPDPEGFMELSAPELNPEDIDVNQVSDMVGKYTGSIVPTDIQTTPPTSPAQ